MDADADVAASSTSSSPSPRTTRARPHRRARDDDESTRVDRFVLGGITAVATAVGGITAGRRDVASRARTPHDDSKTKKKTTKSLISVMVPFTTWSCQVSISVPRACEARALPIELQPRTVRRMPSHACDMSPDPVCGFTTRRDVGSSSNLRVECVMLDGLR